MPEVWSDVAYGLKQLLVNPGADYGDMDSFLYLLPPGAYVAGLGFQNCFLRWLVPRRHAAYWVSANRYQDC